MSENMGMMGRICNAVHGLKPIMMMVVVNMAMAGVNVLYKVASNDGMSLRVLVAYRFLFAAAFIVPLAYYVERKSRPKLTWVVVGQAFLSGLFGGSLAQNLYIESLVLTSATFASAMYNLVPAITFIMGISFGLESLVWSSMAGKSKVVGTLMGIGGAMLFTFYKGVEIDIWSTHVDLLHHQGHVSASHSDHHVLGVFLALGSCVSYALWLIIQAKMSERYPCHYSSTALMTVMGSIQAVGFALCMERDWNQWKLGWDIRLLTVAYCGIVASGVVVIIIAWCVHMRGPLFVSVFNPLMLILVAIAGSFVLDEQLHLGSVLGALLIVIGLNLVLWGKSKETEKDCSTHASGVAVTSSVEKDCSTESKGIDINMVISSVENNIYNCTNEIIPTVDNEV